MPLLLRRMLLPAALCGILSGCGTVPVTNVKILPHMEGRIIPGQNYVYCPTFQMAWDKVRDDLVKEPLKIEGNPELAAVLNRNSYDPANLDSSNVLVAGGYVIDGAVEDIRKRFIAQFGTDEPVRAILARCPPAMSPGDFLMIGYLKAALRFEEPFYVFQQPLRFHSVDGSTNVAAVGVAYFSTNTPAVNERRWHQVQINDYRGEDDFIITLLPYPDSLSRDISDNKLPQQEELVVAMIPPGRTLRTTWSNVVSRVEAPRKNYYEALYATDILKLPKISFNLSTNFSDILDRSLLNTRFLRNPVVIWLACQQISFDFDERGVQLKSLGGLGGAGCAPPKYMPPPRRLVVDRPFLMALRRPGHEPYLVLWIENPAFLTGLECSADHDAYYRGYAEADAALRKGIKTWKVREAEPLDGADIIRRAVRLKDYGVTTVAVTNVLGSDAEALDSYIHGHNARVTRQLQDAFSPDVLYRVEESVKRKCERGLMKSHYWIQDQQNKDGSWGTSRTTRPILTGLCLLAFMARGESKTSDSFGETIAKGFEWLIANTTPGKSSRNRFLPENTLAELCLLQAHLFSPADKEYASAAAEGLRHLLANDKDRSYWYLLALRLAQQTRLSEDAVSSRLAAFTAPLPTELTRAVVSADDETALYWVLARYVFSTNAPGDNVTGWLKQRDVLSWNKEQGEYPVQQKYSEAVLALFAAGATKRPWGTGFATEMYTVQDLDGWWNYPVPERGEESRLFNDTDRRVYTTAMAQLILSVWYRHLGYLTPPDAITK